MTQQLSYFDAQVSIARRPRVKREVLKGSEGEAFQAQFVSLALVLANEVHAWSLSPLPLLSGY
jgi:hypothetical protein